MIFDVAILSISLSVDALFVGFSYGLSGTRIPLRSKLVICFFSILYAGIAIFAGDAVLRFIPAVAGKLIGALILALIGLWMIFKSFVKNAPAAEGEAGAGGTIFKVFIKSLGITVQIVRNPDAGDIDRSGVIDMREAILLGSALSIDALGVGFGSAISGLGGWYVPLCIGLCQLVFLSGGLAAGARFGFLKKIGGRYGEMIPGVFLIALSVLRLF